MKRTILLLLSCLFILNIMSQNLVDENLVSVKTKMKKSHSGLSLDERSLKFNNPSIKYTDLDETKTFMFFFDDNNKCIYSKFVLDNDLLKHSYDSLNNNYKYLGKLQWADKKKSKEYIISMQKTEWFFTLIIQEK